MLRCYPTISFARRVVTRPSSNSEDHDSLTEAAFCEALAARSVYDSGGRRTVIIMQSPARIDDEIRDGCTVVCNVSRAIVAKLRTAYANTTVVLITAPLETLAKRLSCEPRASDETVERRLARNDWICQDLTQTMSLKTAAQSTSGVARLLEIIRTARRS